MAENKSNGEELSLDELLTDSKQYIDEELPSAETVQPSASEQKDFEPDFGDAFSDYGTYEGDAEAEPEQKPVRRRRRRLIKKIKFPFLLKLAIYFAVVALLGVLLANVGWSLAEDVLGLARPDMEVEITVNNNYTLDDIASTLKENGAIRYEWLFKLFCTVTHKEHYFDPGVYTINLTYDYNALVNNLMAGAGKRETITLMIIEGASCSEIFDLLESNNVCTRAALEQCAAEYEFDYDFLRGIPYGDYNRLEGYLFPDTYEFYLMDEPQNVIARFLRNFDNKMDDELMEVVNSSGYTLHQVITMASIIEGEAANDGERPKVASVIFNRLNNWDNPLLGMDSTVYYAAELLGEDFSLNLDSPYNTYRYPGIPKGPINNPGMNSIRAVLYPEETNYYYFATAKDGLNRFFTNESDFQTFLNSDDFSG